MPSLSGIRERRHAPLWDTIVHPPLPCDLWLTRVDPEPVIVVFLKEQRPWTAPHEWPLVRAVEVKHADDVAGWDLVTTDGWLRMID